MVKRHYFLFAGWVLLMIGMTINNPPWEHGWTNVWIGVGVGLVIAILSQVSDRFGRHLDIGEARFDSETGKQLPPYKDGE